MALHWQHIKGINCADTTSTPIYTLINFSAATNTMPSITVNDVDQGAIVTLARSGQKFTQPITFSEIINDAWTCSNAVVTGTSLTYKISQLDTNEAVIWQGATTGKKVWIHNNGLTAIKLASQGAVTGANATFAGECAAQYFNATSDRRAKDNITEFTGDALSWINHTTIYSFNYATCADRTIGVIAQDINPLEGIDFVVNHNATGDNNDYMVVKESKLVYAAMRAIQQLSDQIQDLQAQIDALKKPQA